MLGGMKLGVPFSEGIKEIIARFGPKLCPCGNGKTHQKCPAAKTIQKCVIVRTVAPRAK